MWKFKHSDRNQSGFTLLESLLALALLGLVVVAFVTGLGTGTRAVITGNEQATAESLARSQLEYVKDAAYQFVPANYGLDPSLQIPASWSISTNVTAIHSTDDGLQEVTVLVNHSSKLVLSFSEYKENR